MPSIARKPRVIVTVAGIDTIPIEVEISTSTHRNADNFSATLSLDATEGLDDAFFSNTPKMPVIIKATDNVDLGGWATLFTGNVDTPAINFASRQVIIAGRDKTADLLETKTTEKWLNKTTEEIVSDIAGRVGLTADVVVNQPDKVGLIYKDDHNRISNEDVLWNVLVLLADREGCAVFVKQDRLIFKPIEQLGGGTFTVTYQAPTRESYAQGNVINLAVSRNISVSKNVRVSVKSWQQKQKKAIHSIWGSLGGSPDQLNYTYRIPNATKTQADKIAKNKVQEIINRERNVNIDMPGDVTIDPEMTLALTGTGTDYDQNYIISEIRRFFSQQGHRMTIVGRAPDKSRGAATQEA